jgi:glucose-fructose oxidoreductase
VAVVGFAHMHAGDQIRLIQQTPEAELVAVWDTEPARRDPVADDLGVPAALRYDQLEALLTETVPDIAVVCSTTGEHTELVELLAARGVHVILEKPFALTLGDADRMIAAAEAAGTLLVVNWPLAWYPAHLTTQRLIAEGMIGQVTEVHYYDGNRGPLTHGHDKLELLEPDAATKAASWWYQPEFGGGSLLDYLGYGATIATWFRDGELPERLTAITWGGEGLQVDEQSVVAAAYASGLSTFQTRWGTFSNPWTHQPAPACGFVVVGTAGTITSRDFAPAVQVQTPEHPEGIAIPVDTPRPDQTGALGHLLHCLRNGTSPTGPSSTATSRMGQQIVDTAVISAVTGRTVALLDSPAPARSGQA